MGRVTAGRGGRLRMNENTTLRWHMPGDERGGWKGEGKKKRKEERAN